MTSWSIKRIMEGEIKSAESLQHVREERIDFEQRNTFFEMLIKSLPGIFYVIDDKLNLIMWNRNAEAVTGYTYEVIQQKGIFDLFHEEHLPSVKEAIDSAFRNGEASVEVVIRTLGGKEIPCLFTGVSAEISETPYLLGIGLDIGKRKEAEDALKETENLYRIFAQWMTEGVALLHGSRILFANNAFASMLGYDDPNVLLGGDVTDYIHKDFDIYFRDLIVSVEQGQSQERYFRPGGSIARRGRSG